ncbi:hypothetical protein T265_11749 [Opisthorchis viverrini]|uniref:Reverse transcriptase domain-containing protein n=1 Tax=Opisthorchis viverrini TaxID=6198 RepID=A0A074Z8D1_OPIVI|nr:hypothetical protein T265_11749 [Opisthorchis viverrini]KER19490.1 hypothetical protein T265_11749 [Opisthorchis viverrini]
MQSLNTPLATQGGAAEVDVSGQVVNALTRRAMVRTQHRHLDFSHLDFVIIIIESMTSVFNTDASLPYNHDLFESLIHPCLPCHYKEARMLGYCQVVQAKTGEVLEQRHMYRRPTLLIYLDFKCVFDSVERSVLLTAPAQQGMPIMHGGLSKSFLIKSGMRQGCPLSPLLFTFVVDEIMARILVIKTPVSKMFLVTTFSIWSTQTTAFSSLKSEVQHKHHHTIVRHAPINSKV